MLTLTFLGVGSAFAKRNFQSNALLEAWSAGPDRQSAPDDVLLIDFGATGPLALHALKFHEGFSYLDDGGKIRYPAIRRIFVTHQHADHIGGLEELAWMSRWAPEKGPCPELISTAQVLENLWACSLSGGLGAMPGRKATAADFFTLRTLLPFGRAGHSSVVLMGRYEVYAVPTDHVQIQERFDWPSVGVLLRDAQTSESVFYSGDTKFDPQGFSLLWGAASLIFHEVQLVPEANPVHTLLSELQSLPAATKRKMVLYHYADDWDDPSFAEVSKEFAGFAEPRRRYTLFR